MGGHSNKIGWQFFHRAAAAKNDEDYGRNGRLLLLK